MMSNPPQLEAPIAAAAQIMVDRKIKRLVSTRNPIGVGNDLRSPAITALVVRSNNQNVFSQSRSRVTGRAWIGQSGPWIVTGVL